MGVYLSFVENRLKIEKLIKKKPKLPHQKKEGRKKPVDTAAIKL